jgi:hypothetical protein
MSRRRIGQEAFFFSVDENVRRSSLDDLVGLIEWAAIDKHPSNKVSPKTNESGSLWRRLISREAAKPPKRRAIV